MNTFQKTLIVAGMLGLGSAVAAPAFASDVQAYASGSSTIVLMNGASLSLGAEIAAPSGSLFANPGVVVTPIAISGAAGGPVLDTNNGASATLVQLDVTPGTATGVPNPASSVEAAVATKITAGLGNDASVSFTRAWQSGLQ